MLADLAYNLCMYTTSPRLCMQCRKRLPVPSWHLNTKALSINAAEVNVNVNGPISYSSALILYPTVRSRAVESGKHVIHCVIDRRENT